MTIETETALRDARDPTTPPERLRTLAGQTAWYSSMNLPIQRLLVANPNTPPDVLEELISDCPEAFLSNPAAPLLTLEDPSFYDRVAPFALKRILTGADAPAWLVRHLAGDRRGGIAKAARLHIAVTPEAPTTWREDMQVYVFALGTGPHHLLQELLEHGLAPPWVLTLLAGSQDEHVRRETLTFSPAADALRDLMVRASGSPDGATLGPEPPSPNVAPVELAWLAQGEPFLRLLAARHPNTPPEVLAELTRDKDSNVCLAAAGNSAMSADAHAELLKHANVTLRIAIAHDSDTAPEVLHRLASDPVGKVRAAVARHAGVSADVLTLLAEDTDIEVRIAVARHLNTLPETLTRLADDGRHEVRRALANRDTPSRPAKSYPRRPNTVRGVFPYEYEAVAITPNFAAMTEEEIAESVHGLHGLLERDSRPMVRRYIRRNASASIWKVPEVWRAILKDANSWTNTLVHFFAWSGILIDNIENYLRTPKWEERVALALNPRLPREVTESLSQDGNVIVRAAARATLDGETDPLGLWQYDLWSIGKENTMAETKDLT